VIVVPARVDDELSSILVLIFNKSPVQKGLDAKGYFSRRVRLIDLYLDTDTHESLIELFVVPLAEWVLVVLFVGGCLTVNARL